jgi:vacuolar-type H+-ATPase subunit H
MKEVVDEILAAEKKVDALLDEARQEAARIRQESEKEATALVSAAQEQAQEHLRSAVTAAREEAQRSRDTAFAESRKQQQELRDRNHGALDTLVSEIVTLITSSEQQR